MTVLYILENFHELKYKLKAGTLEGYLETNVKTLAEIVEDEDYINYKNGALKVIIYHYLKGMTYEEIAEVMRIGVSTVYKYRDYTLGRLSEIFDLPVK